MTENRKWQTGEDLTIDAKTIIGEKRKYIFKELNQEHGSAIFHHHVMIIINQWSEFRKLIDEFKNRKETDGQKLFDQVEVIARFLPTVFSWDEVKKIASVLLSDHSVETDEKGEPIKYIAGEDGFSDLKGDPLEIYHAIVFAMIANWPKYLLPLLDTVLEDSTQDSEPAQQQSEEPAK